MKASLHRIIVKHVIFPFNTEIDVPHCSESRLS